MASLQSETTWTGGRPTGESVVETARRLSAVFAERAERIDAEDRFVAENYALLKEAGLVEAAVPAELGGRGAEIGELCDMLRTIARTCGSTALAFAMHTHQVAIPAWRWRHQKVTAVEGLLKRVAAERIVLMTSGGSDWVGGSGSATKVDGGYRIAARKIFASGAEIADVFMTGAVVRPEGGPAQVIHFGLPMKAAGVTVLDTWRTLGMRGTGSQDVALDDAFVPDASVALSRDAGKWHPLFQIIGTIAIPLIYAVYLGIAESARDIAVDLARGKPGRRHAVETAGRMDTALRTAQLAHRWMVETAERNQPSAESINEVMIGRSIVADNAIRTVELAMEVAGGAAFYRKNGLERRFRDVQGARYHPMQAGPQAEYAGAMALGLPTAEIF